MKFQMPRCIVVLPSSKKRRTAKTANKMWITIVSLVVLFAAFFLPAILKERDDRHFVRPRRSDHELQSLGACSGNTRIDLSNETLSKLEASSGKRHVGTVELDYITTRCNIPSKEGEPPAPNKEHILLVHGTGLSSTVFTRNDEADDGPILWDLFRSKGYDVTAVDLRGHGASEITPGPYSVELHGADTSAFIRTVFPDTNGIHCWGLSVGFGTCMAMAVHDPDIVKTLSGNGFLFDRTNADIGAWISSREPVVRMLGIALLSRIGQLAMKISTDGLLYNWMKHTHMDGYSLTAAGWLSFDLTWALANLTVPTLYILPEYDNDIGHTIELVNKEIQMMPRGIGRVIEFPGHSHCMLGEKDGPQKIADAVLGFLKAQAVSEIIT